MATKRTHADSALSEDEITSMVIRYFLSCQASGKIIDRKFIKNIVSADPSADDDDEYSSRRGDSSRSRIKNYMAAAKSVLERDYGLSLECLGPSEYVLVSTLAPEFKDLVSKCATESVTCFHSILLIVCTILIIHGKGMQFRHLRQHLKSQEIELTNVEVQKMRRGRYFLVHKGNKQHAAEDDEDALERDLQIWTIGDRMRMMLSARELLHLLTRIIWTSHPEDESLSREEWAKRYDSIKYDNLQTLVSRAGFY